MEEKSRFDFNSSLHWSVSTFPQSFPHMRTLGGAYGLHNNNTVYIHYIQLYTTTILFNPPNFFSSPPPLNNIILFIPLSILLHCPIQSIKLLSFSTLYYIYYHIILFAISSPSILSIQSNLYYYISLPWYSYTIFNTISHRPISFYLIYYIISILYQYNIYYHII